MAYDYKTAIKELEDFCFNERKFTKEEIDKIRNPSDEQLLKVAEVVNDRFGVIVDEKDVREAVTDDITILLEIHDNTYTDPAPIEIIADLIVHSKTNMDMPCYGDTEEYKNTFYEKAIKAGLF